MRLYSIEFLRIIFTFMVIFGHCRERYPVLGEGMKEIFHSKKVLFANTGFCVELFFIIAGFFLFKKLLLNQQSAKDIIKKLYFRVAPTFIFLFLLCVLFRIVSFSKMAEVLSLTSGLSIPKEVTGWGDWYVGVYFWVMAFYVGLFLYQPKKALWVMLIVMYFTICLKFNAPYNGWVTTYYTIIGSELIRGIYSVGLGLGVGYLASNISINENRVTRVFFTIVEAYCLFVLLKFMIRGTNFDFLELEIIFGILLISISKSWGYLSAYFNRISSVQFYSKYSYQVFLMHIFPLRLLLKYNSFGFEPVTCVFLIFGGAIVLGVFEYHMIEGKLLPYLKKIVVKNEAPA